MCFHFYYQDIATIVKKKKKKTTSPENFGTKTKRLSEFSNEGTFLHALELSMESIRVATTIPTKKPPNFRDERSSPKTSEQISSFQSSSKLTKNVQDSKA